MSGLEVCQPGATLSLSQLVSKGAKIRNRYNQVPIRTSFHILHNILLQIFDVIQSDAWLQKQVILEFALKLFPSL